MYMAGKSKIFKRVQVCNRCLFVYLPRDICRLLDIDKGDVLRIDVEQNKIVLAPILQGGKREREMGAANPKEASA
jgi:bifunctional DNA-binding transcriptional regulator/antitoxin component of YhaV-PrlF toxin-antitoxin module